MRKCLLLGATALLAVAVGGQADDEVKNAAKKLAEKANYSWTTTTDLGPNTQFKIGPLEGKTADGLSWTSVTFGQNTIEAVMKGEKAAAKTQDGWMSLAELTAEQADPQNPQNRGRRFMGRMLQNFKTPAAEAENLIAKTKELKKTDDAFIGDFTEEGAIELLTFGRRSGGNAPAPTNPKGAVKFWIKDGVLSKYEVHLEGTITFNGNEVNTDRTTTTEIKDIGSTKLEVPEEAKGKL